MVTVFLHPLAMRRTTLPHNSYITLHVWLEEDEDELRARLIHPPLPRSVPSSARGYEQVHRLLDRGLEALQELLRR